MLKENLDDLAKNIPAITTIHQDLQSWGETKETVSRIDDFDGLVNCAAVLKLGAATDVPKEQMDLILDANLKAAMNLMQVIGKKDGSERQKRSVVNISSIAITAAISSNMMSYCVAKAGLDRYGDEDVCHIKFGSVHLLQR